MYDSHAHVLSADTATFPLARPDDEAVRQIMQRPFDHAQILAEMDEAGVGKALIVQRSQIYGFDNRYVLAAAKISKGRLKAVCNLDVRRPDCAAVMAGLQTDGAAGYRLMAGLREEGYEWLEGTGDSGFWPTAASIGLPVCVHFFAHNRDEGLARLDAILREYPISHVVIDHLTNGPITSASDCGIDDPLKRIAQHANVMLKFTAIPLNQLAERDIPASEVLAAYLSVLGEDRMCWGSDVTQSKGDYASLAASGRAAVAGFDGMVAAKLLQHNTSRVYGL